MKLNDISIEMLYFLHVFGLQTWSFWTFVYVVYISVFYGTCVGVASQELSGSSVF